MFPEHWKDKATDRLRFNDHIINKGMEDFNNSSDLKIFHNRILRQIEGKNILLKINLEERRNRLRNLLAEEDKAIAEEHTKRIETLERRRDRLREFAMRIRYQKEIERKAEANEKYFQRDRLNDNEIRTAQRDMHFAEILKDWEKLKDIKERIRREEKCEFDFWSIKLKEERDKMLEREKMEAAKLKVRNDEILNQIKDREEKRALDYENELKIRKFNAESAKNLQNQMEQEKLEAKFSDKAKKQNFRKALDRHIQLKNKRLEDDKKKEEAFDIIMMDENAIRMNKDSYDVDKKKRETLKHLKNHIDRQKCIKQEKEADNKRIDSMVKKAEIENHKKFVELQYLQRKKYADLIRSMNESREDHLKKMNEAKIQKAIELKIEKDAMNEFIKIELEKEEKQKQKEKEKIIIYNDALSEQIKFNSHLNELAKEDKIRELNSYKEAEENYQKILKEIKDKEELLFVHPWRSQITNVK